MRKMGLLLLIALSVSPLAISQTHSQPFSAHAAAPAARIVTLGNSVVALDGEWKFHPGDSLWVNGAPEWAQPGYDDSKWAAMDLTPKAGSVDLETGTSGFVPGWTKQGYPKLTSYAWYRLRLKVADPGQPLWLKMPINVDDAYQVYVNGKYVGQFGGFSGNHVTLYYTEPVSFVLPPPRPDGEMLLAVRFYMSPSTLFSSPDAGGMHAPPALGLASTVGLLQSKDEDAGLHRNFSQFLRELLFLLVAPLALWAWLKNREERAWLWLFLALVSDILVGIMAVFAGMTTLITIASDTIFDVVILNSLILPFWTMLWWNWFGLQEKRWIPRVLWVLTAAEMLATLLVDSPLIGLSLVPETWLHTINTALIWCGVALGLLLVVILVEGFRRDRTEALLAAAPILLVELAVIGTNLLAIFDIPNEFFPFGLGVSVGHVASILMVLVIGLLALRRFLRTQVSDELARQAVKKDLEQAQQLQQRVLVPEAIASKHFMVETEYLPAQTVGGDFFQTLSRPDGALLVVIGDVSGKGVSAAMLVAVLVGTIRTRADESFDPTSMLAALNQRLMGRSGGHFATCLAAEIKPDGTMRIANAGHLPPYLNGKEMELEGSLPLGIAGDTSYPARIFTLQSGDRLTFMTDGVVEATNEAKELFGFDRAREVSRERAAAIAQQAQSFGQEDDITVVGVAFAAA
jgi:Stage II sporulation protein E (SpoIIE)